jgi:hypothetical protein
MAQTLAITYNILHPNNVPDPAYATQTVGSLTCSAYLTAPLTGLGLSSSSTVSAVRDVANALIGNSIRGGSTTQAQAGAMNSLLSCLNRETP